MEAVTSLPGRLIQIKKVICSEKEKKGEMVKKTPSSLDAAIHFARLISRRIVDAWQHRTRPRSFLFSNSVGRQEMSESNYAAAMTGADTSAIFQLWMYRSGGRILEIFIQ